MIRTLESTTLVRKKHIMFSITKDKNIIRPPSIKNYEIVVLFERNQPPPLQANGNTNCRRNKFTITNQTISLSLSIILAVSFQKNFGCN